MTFDLSHLTLIAVLWFYAVYIWNRKPKERMKWWVDYQKYYKERKDLW